MPKKVLATHLAGSDISYTCVGGNNYKVTLTFYRDCRGQSLWPNGVGIEFRSASCNRYFTDTLLLLAGSGQEISYPCPGLTTACDDPTSPNPGIQEFRYEGIVTFPMQCSDWIISWTYCCRNCDITTMVQTLPCVPGTNPGMYISTALDNLNFNCNSSPYFTNVPIVFVCIGQSFTYNHGATDPDGDSLAYSLVNPLINSTDSIPFISGYSATNPITSSPGLAINPLNGDITMTPTQAEVGVLSVLVEEYRNGLLIGHVIRDMEIYVRQCNNNIPTATGMNGTAVHDSTICPNTQICFDVLSNDLDVGQIVTMTWNQQIPNATFTVSGFPHPTGHFCWTPTVNDISTIPHQFTVSVVDNACPNSGYQAYAFTITVNSPLVNINVTDISCTGLNDGSIAVVPVNPGGFSYQWSPGGQTTSSISGLSQGTYDVTVYDSTTGCSATFTDTITNPGGLNGAAFVINSACAGSNTGVAAVIASGGTPPYSYSWNTVPPILNDTASGIPGGTYVVTVTDAHGCITTDTVNVNNTSSPLNIVVTHVDSLPCYTSNNGTASISVSGGTPGYTYSWSTTPVQTGTMATGLSPGTYYITVTDTLGCSNTDSATVYSPDSIFIDGHSADASCAGGDGSAYVDVSGGVPGYVYAWAGSPNTTDSLSGLNPGVYTITVMDTNGCSKSLDIVVGSQTVSANASALSNSPCTGGGTGSAIAAPTGGTPPYTFLWNSVPPQTGDTATALAPGTYQVTVMDSLGCTTVDTVVIQNSSGSPVVITIDSIMPPTCHNGHDGAIDISVAGGQTPYSFVWVPGPATTEDRVNIDAGFYSVTVTDVNGCTSSELMNVPQPPPVPANAGPDTAICAGTFLQLSATPISPNSTGTWSDPLGTGVAFSNVNDPSAVASGFQGGYTNLLWTVTDSIGCTGNDLVSVFNYNVTGGADVNQCGLAPITLNATSVAGTGLTGLWSGPPDATFGDVTLANTNVTLSNYAIDTLLWTISGAACTASDTVLVATFEVPTAEAGDMQTFCIDQGKLAAVPPPFGTGEWDVWLPSAAIVNDTLDPYSEVSGLLPGINIFQWSVTNYICVAVDTVIVDFDTLCDLDLPTGFSPNGDLFNDGYLIRGIEAAKYRGNYFRVFNRWGNEVYFKEDYQNTDWMGQNKNGDDLPEATYFVILEIKNTNIIKNTYVDLRRFTKK